MTVCIVKGDGSVIHDSILSGSVNNDQSIRRKFVQKGISIIRFPIKRESICEGIIYCNRMIEKKKNHPQCRKEERGNAGIENKKTEGGKSGGCGIDQEKSRRGRMGIVSEEMGEIKGIKKKKKDCKQKKKALCGAGKGMSFAEKQGEQDDSNIEKKRVVGESKIKKGL